jgi:hypothetical protein
MPQGAARMQNLALPWEPMKPQQRRSVSPPYSKAKVLRSPPPDKVKPILKNGWNSPDVAAEEGVTEGEDVKPEGDGEGSKSKSQLSNEKGEDMVETREQP